MVGKLYQGAMREHFLRKEIERLEAENAKAKHAYRRLVTQDILAYVILGVVVFLTIFITFVGVLTDISDRDAGLVKDVILIISSNLGTAISVIYSVKKQERDVKHK